MPVPGKDFPWYIKSEADALNIRQGTNETDDQLSRRIDALSEDDLWREGLERRGPKIYCGFCETNLENGLVKHLVGEGKKSEAATHRKWLEAALDVTRRFQEEDGWRFFRESVTLVDRKFSCACCKKSDEWWKVYDHIETNAHKRARWALGDPPPVSDSDIESWRNLFAQPLRRGQQAAVAAISSPTPRPTKRPTEVTTQEVKRARPTPAPSSTSTAPAVAPALPQVGGGVARVPSGMEHTPRPDAATLTSMVDKAANKYYPALDSPLRWGKDAKKGGLWIWCSKCEEWVGWVLINWNNRQCDIDPDGCCQHYTDTSKKAIMDKAKGAMG